MNAIRPPSVSIKRRKNNIGLVNPCDIPEIKKASSPGTFILYNEHEIMRKALKHAFP